MLLQHALECGSPALYFVVTVVFGLLLLVDEVVVNMLASDRSDESRENAAGALMHLAIDSVNKVLIAKADGIKPLLRALETGSAKCQENAAGALANLSMNEENDIVLSQLGAVETLVGLLHVDSTTAKCPSRCAQ